MATNTCPQCSGAVAMKAMACPHCGAVLSSQMSEKEELARLADELGSMSEAIAAMERKAPRPQGAASAAEEPSAPGGISGGRGLLLFIGFAYFAYELLTFLVAGGK